MSIERDVLKDIQEVGREMLCYFDSLCQENDIHYFVMYGTGIGTIRHKNYIPWDDDVDVGMLRSDYEKLRKLFNYLDTGDYFLIDPTDQYEWHEKIFPRIYKRGTIFESEDWHETYASKGSVGNKDKIVTCYRPIWIDIFVFDYASTITEIEKKGKAVKLLKWIFTYSKYKVNLKKRNKATYVKRIIYYLLHWIPNRERMIYKLYLKIVRDDKPDKYLVSYDPWEKKDLMSSVCQYSDIFPTKRVPFASFEVNIQNEYDKVLKKTYGNYMELPPEHLRKAHPPYFVKLSDDL